MSMELAVWEGRAPADAEAAVRDFEVLYECYVTEPFRQQQRPKMEPPTPRVLRFARALTAMFPDDVPGEEVWAEGPLESAAIGRLMHWSVSTHSYDVVEPRVAQLAREHGLVCYAPIGPDLLTPAAGGEPARGTSTLPSPTLAVWDGPEPVDHADGHRQFIELYDRYVRSRVDRSPSRRVRRFIRELGRAFPEGGTEPASEWGPAWSDGPGLGMAVGPFVYWSLPMERYVEVQQVVKRLAVRNGLVGYAPRGQLVLTWLTGERRRRLRSDAGD